MPTKITALAQASIISETDLLYAVAGGNSRKIPAAALAGRNRIINGQGRVNQRAYASGAATSGANQYTLDRWRVVTSGQSLTFTGTDAGRTMTAPAGGCEQVIELSNIEGGTYIINWTGTATCTVDGTSRVKGETFTKGANTQCTVRMIGGTFTDVQVELGTTATPFERLPFGDELARCQRYFQKSYALSDAAGTTTDVGLCVSVCPTTVVRVQVPFLARMSGLPSVAFYTPAGVVGNIRDQTGGANVATTAGFVSPSGFVTSLATLAAGDREVRFHWVADAEL